METWFAPAERASNVEWGRQAQALSENTLVRVLLDSIEGHLVVLNRYRQVVAGNPDFLSLLGHSTLTPGMRLGELLHCENSAITSGGCGTSPGCHNCGAVLAMLRVQETQTVAEGECHLSTLSDGRRQSREFQIRATPLEIGREPFIIFVFQDISSEKRRQALEQVFFHDIRNLLGGLSGFGELMSLRSGDRAAETIVRLSRLIKGEVDAQALLARAEAGDFEADCQRFPTEALVRDVSEVFQEHPVSKGRTLKLELLGPRDLQTDRVVVARILVNMVKNAFEATPSGGEVLLRVAPSDGGVRFTVSNPGAMEPDVASRVFERTFTTKNQPVRGLGTYSMRLLAEGFLGARVSFTSTNEEGTSFFLDLPDQSPVGS